MAHQPDSETKFRPFLLQGHERPLTCITFNADGDLFFSSGKDKWATVWRSETGERLGSYEGHNGSIWNLHVTPDSRHLFTASADNSCKVWDVNTGKEVYSFEHDSPCRNVQISTVRPPNHARSPPSLHTAAGPPRHCPLAYSSTQPHCAALRGAELTGAAVGSRRRGARWWRRRSTRGRACPRI